MNGASQQPQKADSPSLVETTSALLLYYLRDRRVLAALALLTVGAGLALNWGWLVAAGIAPVLLALAPCAAMCALGLCMSKMGGKSCSSGKDGSTAGKDASERGRQ